MGRADIRCEEAQRLLPEYAGEGEPYPRGLEVHLATCTACASEDARYRETALALATLRGATEAVPAGFTEGALTHLARPDIVWRGRVRRLTHDPRTRYAAASLGGVVVGAAALALLRRRSARRAVAQVA